MNPQLEPILSEIEKAVVGKRGVIEKILMALLAEGHILLDDVPGVGKTTLAVALSRALGLDFSRIQFTPDVLPSDIVGFSVYDRQSGEFVYRPGAVTNANLLLGDEINRTSSKTQSALLEAMEERQITVDGHTYPLPKPFIVIATQNNVGTAGTQLLPYAQMDRFLVRLSVGYPDRDAQIAMLRARQDENPLDRVCQVASREDVLAMQTAVRAISVSDAILDYITRLTMASREHPMLEVGVSPRGALCLLPHGKSAGVSARARLRHRRRCAGCLAGCLCASRRGNAESAAFRHDERGYPARPAFLRGKPRINAYDSAHVCLHAVADCGFRAVLF